MQWRLRSIFEQNLISAQDAFAAESIAHIRPLLELMRLSNARWLGMKCGELSSDSVWISQHITRIRDNLNECALLIWC